MPNLSPEFIEVMRALLGPETDAFLRALDAPAALALRVHRRGEAAMPFIAGAVPWAEGGFYLRPETRPGTSIAHWAGAFYLQEASAMLPRRCLRQGRGSVCWTCAPRRAGRRRRSPGRWTAKARWLPTRWIPLAPACWRQSGAAGRLQCRGNMRKARPPCRKVAGLF